MGLGNRIRPRFIRFGLGEWEMNRLWFMTCSGFVLLSGCQSDPELPPNFNNDVTVPQPSPACSAAASGAEVVETPELLATLYDRWHEGWLGSPAVADLDGDGVMEIVVARANRLYVWKLDGSTVFMQEVEGGRIWASPIVADLVPGRPGLEVAVASRDKVYAWGADGEPLPGFPITFQDELRSLAAGDINGDGRLNLVAVSTRTLEANGQRDILMAWHMDGSAVEGFPPNTTGASKCDDACYVTGGFDQNLALGDVTGDGKYEIFATQDNAYLSLHDGTGRAFDAAGEFNDRLKFLGIRFLHEYAMARQGWPSDPPNDNQAHFTNSAPAIADIDEDGLAELIVLGSVQNASQTDRERGVALWVLRPDGSRPEHWHEPYHAPDFLAGLWDYDGTNVVAATNQVSVADIDPSRPGPEMIFPGFDGRIHAVSSRAELIWRYTYTNDPRVLTGGVLVADLSGDGSPEIVFTSYSPDPDKSHLFILDAGGNEQHKIALPDRGAMPVPTIADINGDGQLEIVVSLKDAVNNERQVLIYTVPGSGTNCLLWPTGRGNYLRNGYIP